MTVVRPYCGVASVKMCLLSTANNQQSCREHTCCHGAPHDTIMTGCCASNGCCNHSCRARGACGHLPHHFHPLACVTPHHSTDACHACTLLLRTSQPWEVALVRQAPAVATPREHRPLSMALCLYSRSAAGHPLGRLVAPVAANGFDLLRRAPWGVSGGARVVFDGDVGAIVEGL